MPTTSFSEVVENVAKTILGQGAPQPDPGIVVDFDHDTKIAKVKVSIQGSIGEEIKDVPWTAIPEGQFAGAPRINTHVMIGYANGNRNEPFPLHIYDPYYNVSRKEDEKRDASNFVPRIGWLV